MSIISLVKKTMLKKAETNHETMTLVRTDSVSASHGCCRMDQQNQLVTSARSPAYCLLKRIIANLTSQCPSSCAAKQLVLSSPTCAPSEILVCGCVAMRAYVVRLRNVSPRGPSGKKITKSSELNR